ncbi:hypothetical protein WAI453_001291 [Rhynchosporium graminicola]|uniref:Uncharacterized protein n=1 Tax=Rhynchosporium graminicola TaxID=2792576 RepID=A0A1E1KB34_9HELO|nr:uncharacterized protein RCO7_08053 [Rhynchosporium commune]
MSSPFESTGQTRDTYLSPQTLDKSDKSSKETSPKTRISRKIRGSEQSYCDSNQEVCALRKVRAENRALIFYISQHCGKSMVSLAVAFTGDQELRDKILDII